MDGININMDMNSRSLHGNMNMEHSVNYNYQNLTAAQEYSLHLNWYMRTLPGRTGNFLGHFIPAIFFFGFSLALLLKALIRARNLPPGKTFAELYIPERDPQWMRSFGLVMMVATVAGMSLEITGEMITPGHAFSSPAHLTLYFGYFVVSFCVIMESFGRLPWDTHRGAAAVCFIASYLMWHSHGAMKENPSDQVLHILLSYIQAAAALVTLYSMRFRDSVLAYISMMALVLLQSLWLIVIGLWTCCMDLSMHNIATDLALLTMVLVFVIALVYTGFGPPRTANNDDKYGQLEFAPLKTSEYDDDTLASDHGRDHDM